jgi:iron complex outermembrane recepter protein
MTSPNRFAFPPTGLYAALAAAGLLVSLPALAQQTPAAKADEDSSQKVVITANKRAEKQRDVAGTVSVLDGSDLERRGARDQEDALKLTPGVQFNKGDIASNTITIRGIGTSTTNEGGGAQQGPTGQYLEDVPLAAPNGKGTVLDVLTWDLDRVEVLRGPQGVLFGSGSLGGAVRYLFNKPRMNTLETSVKAEYARASEGDGKFSLYGMVNTPLAQDVAALRVVAFDRRDPGYVDNLGTGKKDANDVHQSGGRVLVTVRPVKDLTATLVLSTQKTEQGDTFSVSPDPARLEHRAPNNSTRQSTTDFYSLTADWNLGAVTLTSITGHFKTNFKLLIDDTELFASVGVVVPQVTRPQTGNNEATSQELRIASNPGGAFSYVAGAFYQTQKGSTAAKQIDPSAAFGLVNIVDLTSSGGGTEKALFADTEYNFGGGFSAGAGGRYYRTSTNSKQRGTNFGAPSNIDTPDGSDSGFTPKVSVKYRFAQDQLWYGLVSKGYRYGGVNGTAPFEPFKSDSLWNYETGVRLTPAPGVQLDLTAFIQDWKDAQFTYFRLNGRLPESGIDNVGKARSTGLEAALRYRIDAMFDVAASVAYIDAKTRTDTLVPSGRAALTAPAGSRLPGTARLQAALQGNMKFAGPLESQGRFNATWTHVGDRVMFLGGNKPADAFNTLDLGLSFARGDWTLATGLANATNEKGILSITGAPGGVGAFSQYFLQRPRTATVSVRYDY